MRARSRFYILSFENQGSWVAGALILYKFLYLFSENVIYFLFDLSIRRSVEQIRQEEEKQHHGQLHER